MLHKGVDISRGTSWVYTLQSVVHSQEADMGEFAGYCRGRSSALGGSGNWIQSREALSM